MPETYSIRTARGVREFSPDDGHVLPHEHILIDSRVWWEGPGDWREFDDPRVVAGTSRDDLGRLPQALLRENMVLSDWYLAAQELKSAKDSGAQLVVDLTVLGSGASAQMALRAADAAGIAVVVGVGRYLDATLDDDERAVSAPELTERWVRDIETGIEGCLPGIIGEIGTSEVITEAEAASLEAAARTQARSGLPLNIHVHPFARRALDAIRIVERSGADLSRVAISHLDCELDIAQLVRILRTGVYVEFDNFGTHRNRLVQGIGYPDDGERIDAIEELCDRGYENQILLSHDINHRNSLLANGGWGYRHIGADVMLLLERRFGATAITLTAVNPLRLLAVPSL